MTSRIILTSALTTLLILALATSEKSRATAATSPAATQEAQRRAHAFVSGIVQGVGFRDFTTGHARELKVVGWVKNLPDGRVELVAEGERDAVEKLLDFVRKGPAGGRVDEVKVTEEKPTGEFQNFDSTK